MTYAFPSIGTARTRLMLLTVASAFLLAAGDASTADNSLVVDDSILAPMTAEDAGAAAAALAASLPADVPAPDMAALVAAPGFEISDEKPAVPARLSMLVARVGDTGDVGADGEMRCLASAVYFESRGEPLEGQLAVAQAILNRVQSGRYASSICGVIAQRGQFSFDRSRTPAQGTDWRKAIGIARIAAADMWREIAPRAISFHAARLSPGWRGKTRIAQIGNHVFYR